MTFSTLNQLISPGKFPVLAVEYSALGGSSSGQSVPAYQNQIHSTHEAPWASSEAAGDNLNNCFLRMF